MKLVGGHLDRHRDLPLHSLKLVKLHRSPSDLGLAWVTGIMPSKISSSAATGQPAHQSATRDGSNQFASRDAVCEGLRSGERTVPLGGAARRILPWLALLPPIHVARYVNEHGNRQEYTGSSSIANLVLRVGSKLLRRSATDPAHHLSLVAFSSGTL